MSDIRKYLMVVSQDEDERKAGDGTTVEVSVDFEGYTLEHAKQRFFAATSPRVAVQGKLRKAKGGVPARFSCRAVDFGTGRTEMVRPMTPAELLAALQRGEFTPDQEQLIREMLARKA